MTMIELVTSVNKKYFDRYGGRLIESIHKFLPGEVRLRLYCEASKEGLSLDDYVVRGAEGRVQKFDLFDVTALSEYLARARPLVEEKMGCQVSDNPELRTSEQGYNYKWDALTFGKKAFSLGHALRTTQADYLFWVDADIVFFRSVSQRLLIRLFQGEADLVYFGREAFHSETGFIGFNMQRAACREFGEGYCRHWEALELFENAEGWTDCHGFDRVLDDMRERGAIKARNLSWTPKGHVMAHSPLAMYFDHLKGDRKNGAESPERKRFGVRRITEPFYFWLWNVGFIS